MNADVWLRAAEENLHGHLKALAGCPCSEYRSKPHLELFAFGGADIPEFNLAFIGPGPVVDLDATLNECREFYSALGRKYLVNAAGKEPELIRGGWLEEDPFQAMHLDLDLLPVHSHVQEGVEIRKVYDNDGMHDLSSVLCPSWGIAKQHWDGVHQMMLGLDIRTSGAFRGHVLYVNERPVSSLLIFTQGSVAGVQLVSTLPTERGKGWAQRLLIEALHEARQSGATDSVLEATKMGARSYERVGFKGCGWSRYFSPPPSCDK